VGGGAPQSAAPQSSGGVTHVYRNGKLVKVGG